MQKMNKKYVLRILILSSLLVGMLSSVSIAFVNAAAEVELRYDDGDTEIGYFWETAAAGMFLVRFTPTTSGQLVECSFYITNNPAAIIVSVFDIDDNEIEPFSVTPTSTGWFHVDLSTYGMTVSTDVDFYVSIMTTINGAPSLGADTSNPDGRSWIYYSESEELEQYMEGDYMIRALIRTSVYLTVDSPYGTPGGEDWYDPDTNAYATLDTDIVDHGNGTRRVFTHWSGDASGTNYAQSNPITMDENKTAIANWNTQYYLTISTDSGTVTPVSGWYDAGSSVPISATAPTAISGEQYTWLGWTGTGSGSYSGTNNPATITMNGPVTETATWGHEYRLIMDTDVGTTNPSAGENWYDAGSTVQIGATAPTPTSDEQYTWLGWTGTGSGSYSGTNNLASVTINEPITQTAAWKQEYYLTVTSSYGSPTPESGWIEAGESITAAVTSPVSEPSSNTRYSCSGWTGTGSVSTSGTTTSTIFTMNEPSSITWNWNTQYYLTMSTNFGTVTPSSDWYDADSSVQIGATAPTPTSDEQYTWLGWTGTGSGSYSGTNNLASVTINEPITQTAAWKQKFPVETDIQINLSSEKITVGNCINVSGYITPAHEATITLTYKRPDGSISNKTVTSSSGGKFSHIYTLNAEGLWSVMASCSGDADYYGDTSETEEMRVDPKESIWAMLEVILAVVALVVSVIIVGAARFNSRRKRDQIKELIDQIDDAFFTFKRNSRRCEAELYRLKDIVLEQYKSGTINEANYTILNERIDDYINKLSQP